VPQIGSGKKKSPGNTEKSRKKPLGHKGFMIERGGRIAVRGGKPA